MKHVLGLFIVTISLIAQARASRTVDLIMVDTGNRTEFNDNLIMPKNKDLTTIPFSISSLKFGEEKRFFEHGTQMASSLNNQINRLKMKSVLSAQIPWRTVYSYEKALGEAIEMDTKVISLSISGPDVMPIEQRLIAKACERGILVLAASGNDYKTFKGYPGSYDLPCLISISSIDDSGTVPGYANEGQAYIKLHGNNERGTSYSTARAGAFAISYFRKYPNATAADAKQWFIQQFPRPVERSTQPAR